MKLVAMLLVLAVCAMPVFADNIFAEVGDAGTAVAQGMELSLLGGTIGWGAGAFWPLYEIKSIETTIGPFIAFGNQVAAGGIGAKFAVKIPMLDNYVDFVAVGGAYHDNSISREFWVGKTIPLKK